MDNFLEAAIEEAKAGLAEGGILIGSVPWFTKTKLLQEDITDVFREKAPSYMRRSTL
jgi:hypothetical protein